jgi:predicted DNA-binding transcriptional regulator AlpA
MSAQLDRMTKKPQTIQPPDNLVTRKTIQVLTGLSKSTIDKIVTKKAYRFPIMKMLIGRTECWDKQAVLNWMKTDHYKNVNRRKIAHNN